MGTKRYLYGAAVQGIQNFIFQTNELKDIVGASELVEKICTTAFDMFGDSEDKEHSIVRAAGNIKYIFDDEESCRKAVMYFPMKVQNMAPGITISQAVVEYNDDFGKAVDELESKLRVQRNLQMRSAVLGLMGMRRSRSTGLPVSKVVKDEYLDRATAKKRVDRENATVRVCEKAFGYNPGSLNKGKVAFNIEEITDKNDWIAIIHADGNGLGQIVQSIGKDRKLFSRFSRKLDELTQKAAVMAYREIMVKIQDNLIDKKKCIPIRPVVLSGDDLTVIIRGDLALPYVRSFLKSFEDVTRKEMTEYISGGLTACAGIAFIKSSYPFYYGYDLAEALCGKAKKKAKEICEEMAPSCVMFHKVQDSFVEKWEDIVQRELIPCKGVSFEFGPYFIGDYKGYWSIDDLMNIEKILEKGEDEGNALRSRLRQWMSLMHKTDGGREQALQNVTRLKKILEQENQKELLMCVNKLTGGYSTGDLQKYPIYDVMALYSINSLVTK